MEVVTGAPDNFYTFTCLRGPSVSRKPGCKHGVLGCLHSVSALCGSWLPMKTTKGVICMLHTRTRTFAVKTVNRSCEAAASPWLTLRAPPRAQTWWAAFSPGSGGPAWTQESPGPPGCRPSPQSTRP